MARAVASLVPVGIGQNTDPVALFERVVQQPLERAPIRMHLDRAFEPRVVRHFDVGIAPADMREHDAVPAVQRPEQLFGAVGVARHIRMVRNERMRRPVDLLALAHEQHVAVAAEPGIARPFIAGIDHEPSVLVVFARQPVQLLPETGRDLEVVPLMAHAVEKGAVAREFDQFARRIRPDRLLGLAVQVAPV